MAAWPPFFSTAATCLEMSAILKELQCLLYPLVSLSLSLCFGPIKATTRFTRCLLLPPSPPLAFSPFLVRTTADCFTQTVRLFHQLPPFPLLPHPLSLIAPFTPTEYHIFPEAQSQPFHIHESTLCIRAFPATAAMLPLTKLVLQDATLADLIRDDIEEE